MEPNKYFVVGQEGIAINEFDLLKDAELYVAESEHPELLEIIPAKIYDCHQPLNLFLDSSNLTRNKK